VSPLFFPRFVGFSEEMPPMDRLAASAYRLDHRLLAGVPQEIFVEEARQVQAMLSDSVLTAALSVMPPAYQDIEGPRLLKTLQARRALLVDMADTFHDLLAQSVQIHGYNHAASTIRLTPLDDHRIQVRAWIDQEETPYFDQILDAQHTRELRLYIDPTRDTVAQPDALPLQVTIMSLGTPEEEAGEY
ncbi:MAG TPA: hypothetical protein VKP65_20680, partial [Rhodothermales bacterium]|nr:hypothetical protein [Rhodothermales bacterium]